MVSFNSKNVLFLGVHVRSYEVGVMFLPKFFGDEYFEIENTVQRKSKNIFPLMYDLPLVGYRSNDYPWCNWGYILIFMSFI